MMRSLTRLLNTSQYLSKIDSVFKAKPKVAMNILKVGIIFIIFFLFRIDMVQAWGKTGHRIIGGIADKEISKGARLKIKEIIGDESLAMISNYPDFLRNDPKFSKYDSYHYINEHLVQKNKKIDPIGKNILNGIKEFLRTLKQKDSTKKQKRIALSYIVHLVGDLHQPLHVGHKKDKGGNDIALKWFGVKTNLHEIWDEKLIDMQKLSFTEYISFLYRLENLGQLKLKSTSNIKDWTLESKAYLPKAYKFTVGRYWEFKYNFDNINFLNKRLFLAGKRLAVILNSGL